jgi:adenylyl cyclase-associated protein
VLDFQTGGSGPLTVKISDIKQTVYLYKCDGVSVTVEGKCKSIIIDSCLKVALSFADAVAGLEIVNSRSSKVVCSVKVPSVAIDKCDGVHLTLAATSLDAEIVASKSSEMNVCFPDPDAAGEMLERPIPEQYVHKIEGKNVSARVSDLYTH